MHFQGGLSVARRRRKKHTEQENEKVVAADEGMQFLVTGNRRVYAV